MIGTIDQYVNVLVAPTVEPVTLGELKLHCRIDHSDEDEYLTALIKAARQSIEADIQRTMLQTTLQLGTDHWPLVQDGLYYAIMLPRPPLISVTAISYAKAEGGAVLMMPSTDYTVDVFHTPGRITPAYGVVWPAVQVTPNSVVITYVAGYGTQASSVPEPLRLAVKMLAAEWYKDREPVLTGSIATELPLGLERLLSQYRVYF